MASLTKSAFLLYGKPGCSGGESSGTDFSTGNFSEKKENLQWFSSFLVFAEMIGKSCHHLLCPTSAMLLDKLKARFVIVVR